MIDVNKQKSDLFQSLITCTGLWDFVEKAAVTLDNPILIGSPNKTLRHFTPGIPSEVFHAYAGVTPSRRV
jgi:hypothetical protein